MKTGPPGPCEKVQLMRLFIAIQLNEEAKQTVEDVQEVLRWQNVRGKYIPRENLHVTLAFIGEYGDPDAVMELLEPISFKPFPVTMNEVCCSEELWWAGFEPSPELDNLARQVRHTLADGDVPFDKKSFSPHVTILRKPDYSHGRIAHIGVTPVIMEVSGFSLMLSTQGKNGMIYTELGSVVARE